jgi:hypothetical protein
VVNDRVEDLLKEGFIVYGCADDIAISVRENSLSTLRDLVIDALKIVQRWCETKCVKVSPLKTNVMVVTRKYKPEPTEPLKLGGEGNCLHQFCEIFRGLSKP